MNLYATMNDNESSSVLRAITWAGANSYVLSRGLDLDLSISAVAAIVGGIIPKQILRAQLGRNGGKGLRQRGNGVGFVDLATRSIGKLSQVAVCREVKHVQLPRDGVILFRRIVDGTRIGVPVWIAIRPIRLRPAVGKWTCR